MNLRALDFIRCPECRGALELVPLSSVDGDVLGGLLYCANTHWFPVVGGIPRMLPDTLDEHWERVESYMPDPPPDAVRPRLEAQSQGQRNSPAAYDRRTRDNFSKEWENHDLGGRTGGMELQDRVRVFSQQPIRIPPGELSGKVMLDAGCGNGSQSVAYTALGLEVIAIDLSSGLEHGYAFRQIYPGAEPA